MRDAGPCSGQLIPHKRERTKHRNKRWRRRLSLSLFSLARGKFFFRPLRSVEDLDQIDTSRGRRRPATHDRGLDRTIRKKGGHGSPWWMGHLHVQGITQNELDFGLVAGQAQELRLVRGYQQVDDLDLLGFPFRVF